MWLSRGSMLGVALAGTMGFGQKAAVPKPVPVASFELQSGKLAHRSLKDSFHLMAVAPQPLLGVSADGRTVYALVPEEQRRWRLTRMTGWATTAPQETSVEFDGDGSVDEKDLVGVGLTATPDGKSLLVRIFVWNLKTNARHAVVLLIDAESLRVEWRRVSAEPLVAISQWSFAGGKTLLAMEGPETPKPMVQGFADPDALQINPFSVGSHEAAALSLPELTPRMRCRYTVGVRSDAGAVESWPGTQGPAQFVRPSANQLQVEQDGCGDLVRLAGVQSTEALMGERPVPAMVQGGRTGCRAEGWSDEFELMDCVEIAAPGSGGKSMQEVVVLTRQGRRRALVLPLTRWEEASGVLALADGRTYAVVLSRGLHVDVYDVR